MIFNVDDLLDADLNLLVLLIVLYRERNLSKAAKYLNVKQPAVSGALIRLRSLLDDPLFVRAGRAGMRPTDEATRLVEALSPVMAAIGVIISKRRDELIDRGPI